MHKTYSIDKITDQKVTSSTTPRRRWRKN